MNPDIREAIKLFDQAAQIQSQNPEPLYDTCIFGCSFARKTSTRYLRTCILGCSLARKSSTLYLRTCILGCSLAMKTSTRYLRTCISDCSLARKTSIRYLRTYLPFTGFRLFVGKENQYPVPTHLHFRLFLGQENQYPVPTYLHFRLFIGQEEQSGLFVEAEIVEVCCCLNGSVGLSRLPIPHFHHLEQRKSAVR
jgi:hypothetical protein